MNLRHILISLLYIGIAAQPLWAARAEEPPVEEAPPAEILELPASPVPEKAATTTDEAVFSSSAEEEEPELVWGCAMEYANGSDVETERCGLGYYRTICFGGADGEECITFFEFYVEEEEPEDPLTERIESLREKEYLQLSAAINGQPLNDLASHAINLGASSTLSWSYETLPPDEFSLPSYPNTTFEEAFSSASLTFQVYEGAIGSSTLVYESSVAHGTYPELTLPPLPGGTYIFVLAGTYPELTGPPGFECQAYIEESCADEPRWNIESFEWFMEHGRAYYDENEDESDADYRYRDESYTQRYRLLEYVPVAFGMLEVEIGTPEPVMRPSSVLFLPGIKGSRLYKPSANCDPFLTLSCPSVKLWEPSGNVLLQDLFLTASGASHRTDIYVKEGDIMAEALGQNFYASFVNQMNALVGDGTLPAWKAVAYDWRLSLDDLVNNGVKRGEKIYYGEPTDTPYMEQMLRELAAASPTGKVSIVAHSNGGLVAKRLMQRLAESDEEGLVDKIIFVGVPQSGAPQAMAGLLYGYGEALPFDACAEHAFAGSLCSLLGSRASARELAEHSPMAYHLLPSASYFSQVQDAEHSVATFRGAVGYQEERVSYGMEITSLDEMYRFLRAEDGGRLKPDAADTKNANVLPSEFLSYARAVHERIDAWIPPTGVEVYQIAGWGVDTVAGVEFYEQPTLFGGYKEMYRPIFVEDGDGVVPVPSALQMEQGLENVEEFWVNLALARKVTGETRDHGDVLELDEVRILLRNILTNGVEEIPDYVSSQQPQSADGERLIFFLHSPLTLELQDSEGRHVGENSDGTFDQDIPDVTYGEFGDVKYIIAPKDKYEVILNGKASGTFSLDIQNVKDDETVSTMTVADVPATKDTIATLQISEDGITPLEVDVDGNGVAEISILFDSGETVFYRSPEVQDSSKTSSQSRSKIESVVMGEITQIGTTTSNPRIDVPAQEPISPSPVTGEVLGTEISPDTSESNSKSDPTTYTEPSDNLFSWLSEFLYTWWRWLEASVTKIFK